MKFAVKALGSFAICLTLAGQDSPKIQEPEYVNKYFLLQPDGSIKTLEQVTSTTGIKMTKNQMFPVVRVSQTSYAEMAGSKSPVRIPATPMPEFVVKVTSRDNDPADSLALYKTYIEKGQRRVDIAYATSGGKEGTQEKDALPKAAIALSYEKYGERSFKLKPKAALASGEYCFTVKNLTDASCFGVD